jgi:AraC-like DNA-binding protein
MARPLKKIDPVQVEKLAMMFCTNEEIADVLGCSSDTLVRRFAESLKKGRSHAKASLRRHQFKAASAGNAALLIWLGKQHLGQTDKPVDDSDDLLPVPKGLIVE